MSGSHVDQSELWTTHTLAQDVIQTLGGEGQRATSLIRTPWHTQLSGYQALVSQLPHISSIRNIVEYYFEQMNWLYEIVQQFYFNGLLTQWVEASEATASINLGLLSRDLQYFPALVFQIMALALMYIPLSEAAKFLHVTDGQSLDVQSNHYGDLGMKLMDLLGRRNPSVVGVQHDLVRFAWLKNFGCGKNSLRSLQDAQKVIRQRNGPMEETLRSFWYDEHLRRLWVLIFAWDRVNASLNGHPLLVDGINCNIKVPLDCAFPKDPSKTIPMSLGIAGGETPSPFSVHIFRYTLACVIQKIRTSNQGIKDYSIVRRFHERMVETLDDLPSILRPVHLQPDLSWDSEYRFLKHQREEVSTTLNIFLLALHRPYIHTHSESRCAALDASLSILESQERLFTRADKRHRKYFGHAFYTVSAAIFVTMIVARHPSQDQNIRIRIRTTLAQAIEQLSQISDLNSIAGSALPLVLSCYEKMETALREADTTVVLPTAPIQTPVASMNEIPDFSTSLDTIPGFPLRAHEVARDQPMIDANSVDINFTGDGSSLANPYQDKGLEVISDYDVSYWINNIQNISDPATNLQEELRWDALFG
ncbi:hypothetical protein KCU65_g4557, partial [Aureobasidium melanogenum]